MSPAEYSLMKELEAELNRGCPSGFRLSDSEREFRATLYPKIRTITAAEDEFFKRIRAFDIRKFKGKRTK